MAGQEGQVTLEEKVKFTYELDQLHRAGYTARMHNLPTHDKQSVGQHSYGAAAFAYKLAILNGLDPQKLATYMVFHDVAEAEVGDIPAPVKRELKNEGDNEFLLNAMEHRVEVDFGVPKIELTAQEYEVCKVADYAELAFTCIYERRLGNRHPRFAECFHKACSYIEEVQAKVEGAERILTYVRHEWATQHWH